MAETENQDEWHQGITAVVSDPLKFKLKLAIGEDAYTSLRLKNKVFEAWDTFGVASSGVMLAKSTAIASTFFCSEWISCSIRDWNGSNTDRVGCCSRSCFSWSMDWRH